MASVYLAEIDCYLGGTSATTNTVGPGARTWTYLGPRPLPGMRLRAEQQGQAGVWVEGTVLAATATTVTLLVTATAGSGSVGAWVFTTGTLRFTSGRGYTHPSAPGPYEARILQPALFRRDIFDQGKTGGASRIGWGALTLANIDGGLDPMVDYAFDGRRFVLRVGDGKAPYGGFATMLHGTLEQAVFTWTDVSLRLRDRQEELDKPIQTDKYAGNNQPPDGLEGTELDIKGRPKALAYGDVRNAAVVCVNAPKLIYHANAEGVNVVWDVYDRGSALARGTAYASPAALLDDAQKPAAGSFRYHPASGHLRLGSTPAGLVTADFFVGAGSAQRTVAQVVETIITTRGGLTAADLVDADVAALDAVAPYTVGLWIGGETPIRSVLDELCASVGAWWGFDRFGRFRIRRFEAPAGPPALTIRRFATGAAAQAAEGDILKLERRPSNDSGRGVEAHTLILHYDRNWTVQSTDLAEGVTTARRAFLSEEWRKATATDAAVKAAHPLAEEREAFSLLTDPGAAQGEASRLLALHKVRRDRIKATVRFGAAIAGSIDLGDVVKLEFPRFGCDAGKLFRLTGMQYDAARHLVDLDLWG
ncbi:MAG TPA: hypothetical protein VGE72_05060 [Azospirillum sp.]